LHPEKPSEVIKKLRQAGFEGPFGGGKHVIMRHPETRRKISIPVHGGRDIPIGTLRAILRRAGISVEEWRKL
jgi:predicted RNA binding protein YcfA (HicA-like mRNA interferase family)